MMMTLTSGFRVQALGFRVQCSEFRGAVGSRDRGAPMVDASVSGREPPRDALSMPNPHFFASRCRVSCRSTHSFPVATAIRTRRSGCALRSCCDGLCCEGVLWLYCYLTITLYRCACVRHVRQGKIARQFGALSECYCKHMRALTTSLSFISSQVPLLSLPAPPPDSASRHVDQQ